MTLRGTKQKYKMNVFYCFVLKKCNFLVCNVFLLCWTLLHIYQNVKTVIARGFSAGLGLLSCVEFLSLSFLYFRCFLGSVLNIKIFLNIPELEFLNKSWSETSCLSFPSQNPFGHVTGAGARPVS